MSVYIDEAVITVFYSLLCNTTHQQRSSPFVYYQIIIAKEKQQLQEDQDTVKHMTQAKDQQVSMLEQELKQAKLEQKCK